LIKRCWRGEKEGERWKGEKEVGCLKRGAEGRKGIK